MLLRYAFKTTVILMLCCFISGAVLSQPAASTLSSEDLYAESAVLINLDSGEVYWAKAAQRRMYPASITKILTAMLALEQGGLDQTTVASSKAEETDGTTMYVESGEVVAVRDLLYGLLLVSANDAAVVLAERESGDETDFVLRMNQKARAVGAHQTHFANSHGLHDDDHYTTAYDFALIARAAWREQPALGGILQTLQYSALDPRGEERLWLNNNQLLTTFPGILGGKNGYTDEAGFTFVGYAARDGLSLLSVVLNSDDYLEDSRLLLEYGFATVPAGTNAAVDMTQFSFGRSGTKNRLLRLTMPRTSLQEAVLFEVGSETAQVNLLSQRAFFQQLPLWRSPVFWLILQLAFWLLVWSVYRLLRARIEYLKRFRHRSAA